MDIATGQAQYQPPPHLESQQSQGDGAEEIQHGLSQLHTAVPLALHGLWQQFWCPIDTGGKTGVFYHKVSSVVCRPFSRGSLNNLIRGGAVALVVDYRPIDGFSTS